MTIEELKSRDYDGLPVEVCNAVYDTVQKNKYKKCFIVCADANLRDWISLAKASVTFADRASASTGRQDLVFWQGDIGSADLEMLAGHVKKGGQLAVYGAFEVPLRAFFNHGSRWDDWMTIEIPLGDGLYVAKRI